MLAGLLVTEHVMAEDRDYNDLQTLVRLGQAQRAEQILAAMSAQERDGGHMRNTAAVLRLAQDDPKAAIVALAAIIDGSVPVRSAHQALRT